MLHLKGKKSTQGGAICSDKVGQIVEDGVKGVGINLDNEITEDQHNRGSMGQTLEGQNDKGRLTVETVGNKRKRVGKMVNKNT